MKNKLTIFGSCIVGDIFVYANQKGDCDYLIRNSSFQMSPITANWY